MTKLCVTCRWCDQDSDHPRCRNPRCRNPVGLGVISCYLARSGLSCLGGMHWEPITKKWWQFWK